MSDIEEMIRRIVREELAMIPILEKTEEIVKAQIERTARPDSVVVGKASEQLKFYFNAQNKEEAELIKANAISIRESTVSSSALAIEKRRPELRPKSSRSNGGSE